MDAGRELDKLVAEKVMGFYNVQLVPLVTDEDKEDYEEDGVKLFGGCGSAHWMHVPHYSTMIAAAWEVVEKLRKQMCCLRIVSDHEYLWEVYGIKDPDDSDHENPVIVQWKVYASSEDSAPLAICLAALKAVGYDKEPHV